MTPAIARPVRWTRRIAIILILTYLVIVVSMMALENSLLFFPTKYPDGDWTPPGLSFEDAWFTAADGIKLHGWYIPCENPQAVVLFAHGNGGNLSHRADLFQVLHEMRIAVLAFDYRGYGRSEGSPNEAGILADARAVRKWLANKTNLPETQLVLMGESLGGAVVAQLAAESPPRGLILENTFNRVADVAAWHYPWLPVKLLNAHQARCGRGNCQLSRTASTDSRRCRHDRAHPIRSQAV